MFAIVEWAQKLSACDRGRRLARTNSQAPALTPVRGNYPDPGHLTP